MFEEDGDDDLGLFEDDGDEQKKDDDRLQRRNPHCEDDHFEENANVVLETHVDVDKFMGSIDPSR